MTLGALDVALEVIVEEAEAVLAIRLASIFLSFSFILSKALLVTGGAVSFSDLSWEALGFF
jgi:hypothetical protein